MPVERTNGEPNISIVPDAAAMSRLAADAIVETALRVPTAAIAVPTGSTPLGMFAELAARVERRMVDLSRLHLFTIDEYLGVTPDDPNSLTGWLVRTFVEPAHIPRSQVHAMPGAATDPERAAAEYEAELAAHGGLELAVLGLGPNGHVAYNEPGAAADSRTRVVELTPESIAAASAYWQGTVPIPASAMTIGIGTLLEARRLVLIVAGERKADVLRRALDGPMSAEVPASWLRLAGSRLTVIADAAAASQLP